MLLKEFIALKKEVSFSKNCSHDLVLKMPLAFAFVFRANSYHCLCCNNTLARVQDDSELRGAIKESAVIPVKVTSGFIDYDDECEYIKLAKEKLKELCESNQDMSLTEVKEVLADYLSGRENMILCRGMGVKKWCDSEH